MTDLMTAGEILLRIAIVRANSRPR